MSSDRLPSITNIMSTSSSFTPAPSIQDLANIAFAYNQMNTVNSSHHVNVKRSLGKNLTGSGLLENYNDLSHIAKLSSQHTDNDHIERISVGQESVKCSLQQGQELKTASESIGDTGPPETGNSAKRIISVHHASSSLDTLKFDFSCKQCNQGFSSKEALYGHVCLNRSDGDVLYECQECKTLHPTLDELAKHMKVHKQHVVVMRNTLLPHLTRVGYTCNYCDKVLGSKGSLVKHQELHKGLKPFICRFCGKSFSLKGNRDKHELIHEGTRPFKCLVCEKSFTLKGNLHQHMLTHSNLKLYKCHICDKDFTLKGNLDKHLKRHETGMSRSRGSSCGQGRKTSKTSTSVVDFDLHSEEDELRDMKDSVKENGAKDTSGRVNNDSGNTQTQSYIGLVDNTETTRINQQLGEIRESAE